MAPNLGLDCQAAKQALREKAKRKKVKYADLVRLHKLDLVLFLVSSFGAFQDEGVMPSLEKVVGFYGARQQESSFECKDKVNQLLQLAVLKEVARRLMAAGGASEGAAEVAAGETGTGGRVGAFLAEGGFPERGQVHL